MMRLVQTRKGSALQSVGQTCREDIMITLERPATIDCLDEVSCRPRTHRARYERSPAPTKTRHGE